MAPKGLFKPFSARCAVLLSRSLPSTPVTALRTIRRCPKLLKHFLRDLPMSWPAVALIVLSCSRIWPDLIIYPPSGRGAAGPCRLRASNGRTEIWLSKSNVIVLGEGRTERAQCNPLPSIAHTTCSSDPCVLPNQMASDHLLCIKPPLVRLARLKCIVLPYLKSSLLYGRPNALS